MIVRTLSYEYPVIFMTKDDPDWKPDNQEGSETSAYTDFDNEHIYIRSDQTIAMQADALLHEMMHVANLAGGLAENSKYTEEEYVCIVTAGFKQLLTADNDEVWEFLGVNL